MNKENCYLIGSLIKAQGLDGGLVFKYDNRFLLKFNKMEQVFVEIDNMLVPFFISKNSIAEKSGNTCYLHFDDVTNQAEAAELLDKKVYISKKSNCVKLSRSVNPQDISGYFLSDTTSGKKGVIIDFIDNSSNPLLIVEIEGKEILIPAHEDIITNIDVNNKTIVTTTPIGLIDLYIKDEK